MDKQMKTDIERIAMTLLEKRREEKGISPIELARRVFPDLPEENARKSLQYLRLPQTTGKPKRLAYGDFIALCEALDLVPERVVTQTLAEIGK